MGWLATGSVMVGVYPQQAESGGETPTRSGKPEVSVDVFPHGPIDLRAELEALLPSLDKQGLLAAIGLDAAGLRRFHEYRRGIGAETRAEITSANPWDMRGPMHRDTPPGWYAGAAGTTHMWVECLQWTQSSLWSEPWSKSGWLKRLADFRAGAPIAYGDGERLKSWIEVSCTTWHYTEMGDWATSLQLHLRRYSSASPILLTNQSKAFELARLLETRLKATPAPPEAAERRRRREERLAVAANLQVERARQAERRQIEAAQRRADEEAQRRQARREAVARQTFAVLYDTSFLMGGGPFFHETGQAMSTAGSILNIVAEEVVHEIARHLEEDGDTRAKAAVARGRIIELKKAGDRLGAMAQYREVDLSDEVVPVLRDGPLGADSPTDRLLVAYALQLVRTNAVQTVVIATRDGGIATTIDDRRRQTRSRLFTFRDAQQVRELDEIVAGLTSRFGG